MPLRELGPWRMPIWTAFWRDFSGFGAFLANFRAARASARGGGPRGSRVRLCSRARPRRPKERAHPARTPQEQTSAALTNNTLPEPERARAEPFSERFFGRKTGRQKTPPKTRFCTVFARFFRDSARGAGQRGGCQKIAQFFLPVGVGT